jgi:hypothetical protein
MSSLLEKLDKDIARLIRTCESLEATLNKTDNEENADGAQVLQLVKNKTNCGKMLAKLQREREIEKEKQSRGPGDKDKLIDIERRNRLYDDLRSNYIKEETN